MVSITVEKFSHVSCKKVTTFSPMACADAHAAVQSPSITAFTSAVALVRMSAIVLITSVIWSTMVVTTGPSASIAAENAFNTTSAATPNTAPITLPSAVSIGCNAVHRFWKAVSNPEREVFTGSTCVESPLNDSLIRSIAGPKIFSNVCHAV